MTLRGNHEIEMWQRALCAGLIAHDHTRCLSLTFETVEDADEERDSAATAALFADRAVEEYRLRIGPLPEGV